MYLLYIKDLYPKYIKIDEKNVYKLIRKNISNPIEEGTSQEDNLKTNIYIREAAQWVVTFNIKDKISVHYFTISPP